MSVETFDDFAAHKELHALFLKEHEKITQEMKHTEPNLVDRVPKRPSRFLSVLFPAVCHMSVSCIQAMRQCAFSVNIHLRILEDVASWSLFYKTLVHSQNQDLAELKATSKTYRIVPCHAAGAVPVMFLPSPFGLEDHECVTGVPFPFKLLGLENTGFLNQTAPPFESTKELFAMSYHINCGSVMAIFTQTYGVSGSLTTCQFVRQTSRIPCVLARQSERIVLLLGAQLSGHNIQMVEMKPYGFLLQSILLNEMGSYHLFYGHAIVTVDDTAILSSVASRKTLNIISSTAGGFSLVFEHEIPPDIPQIGLEKENLLSTWQKYEISNLEFLVSLNILAGRSFEDVSNYPIFPRVLTSFKSETFSEDFANLRDFAVPLPVLCDPDPSHATIKRRLQNQGYHHIENVSNAIHVTSMLIRLLPHFFYQMDFHNGFDHIDRTFTSIPQHLSIGPMSLAELVPEAFACPEMFENANDIRTPNGDPLPLDLPRWAENAAHFIQLHRYALESPEVRTRISAWVDLTFGYKQSGPAAEQALNLYNPLGYSSTRQDEPMRNEWVISCGQIPERVFDNPCPACEVVKSIVKSPVATPRVMLDTAQSCIVAGKVRYFHGALAAASSYHVSECERFVVVTLRQSAVVVYNIFDCDGDVSRVMRHASFVRCGCRFSVVNDQQLICATVCEKEVVVWSIMNGVVLHIIPVARVTSLTFDTENSVTYVGAGKILFKYGANGQYLQKLQFPAPIIALRLAGGPSRFEERMVVIELSSGESISFKTRA